MKANYHTHSTWCDGRNTTAEMAVEAMRLGLGTLGFSSHAMLPDESYDWVLSREKLPRYVREIRNLATQYRGKMRILCGVEADYIPGRSSPDRAVYAPYGIDYVIGSVHWVVAPDGGLVPVDKSPETQREGIARHFGGDVAAFVRAYYRQVREMLATCDFDILGHVDLVLKFNEKHPTIDERATWYEEEIRRTIEAIESSTKVVELNSGGIARGWRTDFYPSRHFYGLLKAQGGKNRYVLSSDAHSVADLGVPYAFAAQRGDLLDFVATRDAAFLL